MCGITGYWTRNGNCRQLSQDLHLAVKSLHHRGPDDSGVWQNKYGVGLGHTRLSILDVSPAGHQPMVSKDGQWVIVYNGEVYNFREIRKDLESRGQTFHGDSDTEVILACFQEWGIEAVHRFIGMFAIGLWNEKERKMFLLRDRLGVKPLYYGWNEEVFWFGSELKALRCFSHWRPEINFQALGEFFQYLELQRKGPL